MTGLLQTDTGRSKLCVHTGLDTQQVSQTIWFMDATDVVEFILTGERRIHRMATLVKYSQSRKVNTLVKLTLKFEMLSKKRNIIGDEVINRRSKLNGGQMAEYLRILKEHGV